MYITIYLSRTSRMSKKTEPRSDFDSCRTQKRAKNGCLGVKISAHACKYKCGNLPRRSSSPQARKNTENAFRPPFVTHSPGPGAPWVHFFTGPRRLGVAWPFGQVPFFFAGRFWSLLGDLPFFGVPHLGGVRAKGQLLPSPPSADHPLLKISRGSGPFSFTRKWA